MEKKEILHFLQVGGILAAVGAGSALLITGMNAITAPVIAANEADKANGGLKQIYDFASKGEKVSVTDAQYVTEYIEVFDAKGGKMGDIFTASGTCAYGDVTLLIGVGGDASNPTLGKVFVVKDSCSYADKFEAGYVDRYNANPSDATLTNTTCGATYSAILAKDMIAEARNLYMAMGGGFVIDQTVCDSVFGANYVLGDAAEIENANMLFAKRYVVSADKDGIEPIGYLYAGKTSAGTNVVSGYGLDGYANIVVDGNDELAASVATWNSTKELTAWGASADESEISAGLAAMKTHYEANPAKTLISRVAALAPNAVSWSEFVAVEDNIVKGYYSAKDGSEVEMGRVYRIQNSFKGSYGHNMVDTSIDMLVYVYGEKAEPVVGRVDMLKLAQNHPGYNTVVNNSGNYFDKFVDATDPSIYDGSDDTAIQTGVTKTNEIMRKAVQEAVAHYKAN